MEKGVVNKRSIDPVWLEFSQRHVGSPYLNFDPLYALNDNRNLRSIRRPGASAAKRASPSPVKRVTN